MRHADHYSFCIAACAVFLIACGAGAQVADAPDANIAGIPVNYTEARVGNYTLPNPLVLLNGQASERHPDLVQKTTAGNRQSCSRESVRPEPPTAQGMRFEVFDKGTPGV